MFTQAPESKLNKALPDVSYARSVEATRTPNMVPASSIGNQAMLRRQAAGLILNLTPRPSQTVHLHRKCACGGEAGMDGSCDECKAESEASAEPKKLASLKPMQVKLSQPGDRFEQEADATAQQVMRVPDEAEQHGPTARISAPVQERLLSRDPVEGGGPTVQSDDDDFDDMEADEDGMPKLEAGLSSSRSARVVAHVPTDSGQPLDNSARNFMEQRFGQDFGQVRVHADSDSAQSAKSLQARAYTIGSDIYFNQGQYRPSDSQGKTLLAHELTHVVQQTGPSKLSDKMLSRDDLPAADKEQPGQDPAVPETTDRAKAKAGKKSNVCGAGACPQGKQSKVVSSDCSSGEPDDPSDYITDLNVSLSGRTVNAKWSKSKPTQWTCSPRPGTTPTGPDVVGDKCSIKHTNVPKKKGRKPDGMAWFTAFKSHGHRFGFHDSQPVGPGYVSHGCVRVCCGNAEIINKNSWSGKTRINVKG